MYCRKAKHPAPHPGTCFPSPPVSADLSFQVTPHDVLAAIRSFPNGSAGGPDRLLPQHLKDLVQDDQDESLLLSALTEFCILVLQGDIPLEVRPVFFGASLVALRKESGGVRPIAVGCTLRRLCAKVASRMVRDEMADLLSPRQLGFGVPGGFLVVKCVCRVCILGGVQSAYIIAVTISSVSGDWVK